MLGVPGGKVLLVPWTQQWEEEFNSEKQEIENKIGQSVFAIHHIGSTAVKDLSAKPIIDIAIEIKDKGTANACIQSLDELGYAAFRDHLRNNEVDRKRYEKLKIMLASMHSNDRIAYADAKTEFVKGILQ
ncbi:GrpB family protein [Paenibacillus terrigena]|uniref:GrpB family protein n=1 Tax=Paenibacillus terrigena TaxID=369333 RepID=UPI0028D6E938|nr:GrpB family protein [Paenibacillus terrigena]